MEAMGLSPNGKLRPAQSLYLDLMRGLAALAVLFHHYSNHIAKLGYRVFPDVGQEAVMVFFVMSGFVIAMVAADRERDFVVFAVKRFARFYSVIVPVTLLLIAAYFITIVLDFPAYENWGNMDQWPAKLLATLGFSTDTSFWQRVYLPGGKPMWSMSYEFWYYFLFAFCFLFSRRLFGVAIALLIAIYVGVPALLLLPVWALGALTFHVFKRRPVPRNAAWALAVSGLCGLVFLQMSGLRYSVLNTQVLFHRNAADATFFPYYYLVGGCLSLHLFGALNVLARDQRPCTDPVSGGIRRMAHTSFFLYLTHMPVMLLLKAWLGGLVFPFLIPVLACGFALLAGLPVENLRFPLQRRLLCLAKKLNLTPSAALT